jgi:hypothetical protein
VGATSVKYEIIPDGYIYTSRHRVRTPNYPIILNLVELRLVLMGPAGMARYELE